MVGSSLYRFKKQNRLLTAAAFSRVFRRAIPSRDRCFTVLCRPNDKDYARLGLAVSKKHCRQAPARNRLKRIVRESFRQHQFVLGGLDLVVMNQPAATRASNRQLFDSLAGHWRRLSQAAVRGTGPQE